MRGHLFVITGPSGVGKTSVAMRLLEERPNLEKIVTCTTRPMRDGEVNGVDYHFFTHEELQTLIDNGDMFEWDRHYDHLYGSRKSDVERVLASGKDVLFVVDVAGAKTIKKDNPEAEVVFLKTESTEELIERLLKRDGGETAGLETRKAKIEEELAYADDSDHVVINHHGKLEETVQNINVLMGSLDENA